MQFERKLLSAALLAIGLIGHAAAAPKTLEENIACAQTLISQLQPHQVVGPAQINTMNMLLGSVLRHRAAYPSLALGLLDAAIARTDGCALRQSPDTLFTQGAAGLDFVTSCAAQAPIHQCQTAARAQLTGMPAPSTVPLPVGEWKFDDLAFPAVISTATSAYTLKDTLVPSSTTAAKNVFSSAPGKLGNALKMTQDATAANYPIVKAGKGDYSFSNAAGLSIEMWIRPTGHSTSKAATLVAQTTGSVAGCNYNSSSSGYSLKLNTNGTLVFAINGSQGTVTSTSAVADNAWAHVVATYDKANMNIYINGALAGTKSYTAAIVNPVASSSGPTNVECANFKVGGTTATQSADTGNFQGSIDEFRIYNVGLTADQVATRFGQF